MDSTEKKDYLRKSKETSKKKRLGAAKGILEEKEFDLKDPAFDEINKSFGY